MAVRLTKFDLEFIFQQIMIAEADASGEPLSILIPNPEFAFGLRTITGVNNNLRDNQTQFGAADNTFPRLLDPVFRTAETQPADFFGPGSPGGTTPTSYLSS